MITFMDAWTEERKVGCRLIGCLTTCFAGIDWIGGIWIVFVIVNICVICRTQRRGKGGVKVMVTGYKDSPKIGKGTWRKLEQAITGSNNNNNNNTSNSNNKNNNYYYYRTTIKTITSITNNNS